MPHTTPLPLEPGSLSSTELDRIVGALERNEAARRRLDAEQTELLAEAVELAEAVGAEGDRAAADRAAAESAARRAAERATGRVTERARHAAQRSSVHFEVAPEDPSDRAAVGGSRLVDDTAAASTFGTDVPTHPTGKRTELALRAIRAEIAAALQMSERSVEARFARARTMSRHYPEVVSALREARVSAQHAAVIIESGAIIGLGGDAAEGTESTTQAEHRARFAAQALAVAATTTPGRLRPQARRLAERYAEIPLDDRHETARRNRRVWVQDLDDGMAELYAHLPAVEAHAIHDRLTRMAKRTQQAQHVQQAQHARLAQQARQARSTAARAGAAGVGAVTVDTGTRSAAAPGAGRSTDEVRADLLAELLLSGSPATADGDASTTSIHAEIQVVIPWSTIPREPQHARPGRHASAANGRIAPGETAPDGAAPERIPLKQTVPDGTPLEAPAELTGYGPIDGESARRLAAEAPSWERIGTGEHGEVLSVERYRPSAEMRRLLRARDQRCRFPGCRVPAHRCDIDHTLDAARGGLTSTRNLAHLCRGHHTLKHQTGWRVEQFEAGELAWTSPTGRVFRDSPEGIGSLGTIGSPDSPAPGSPATRSPTQTSRGQSSPTQRTPTQSTPPQNAPAQNAPAQSPSADENGTRSKHGAATGARPGAGAGAGAGAGTQNGHGAGTQNGRGAGAGACLRPGRAPVGGRRVANPPHPF